MNAFIERLYQHFLEAGQNITTDSRNITKGCIFFALRGERFDGNRFAAEALKQGASLAVVDDQQLPDHNSFYHTSDVLQTLQHLANHHRKKLTGTTFISLTGSNGKTTTKELIHTALSSQFKTTSTFGNLNNHIGVPLTLLRVKPDDRFAVIEMGANHQKEIELLCSIAEPDAGLITNIGKAHLEGFGGLEGVRKGKGELFDFLKRNNLLIFYNSADAVLTDMVGVYENKVSYGSRSDADYVGTLADNSGSVCISWSSRKQPAEKYKVATSLTGDYNFANVMAAIAVGIYFGADPVLVNHAIENYRPSNQRSQVVKKNSNTFILDYYNANPTSMEAALTNLEKNFTGKKIVILGDMLELGDASEAEHERMAAQVKNLNPGLAIFVGPQFGKLKNRLKAEFFNSAEEAAAYLQNVEIINCTVLIKGSRGLHLENVASALKAV